MYLEGQIKDLGIVTALKFMRIDLFQSKAKSPEKQTFLNQWFQTGNFKKDLNKLKTAIIALTPDHLNSLVCVAIIKVVKNAEESLEKKDGEFLSLKAEVSNKICGQQYVIEADRIVRQSFFLANPLI